MNYIHLAIKICIKGKKNFAGKQEYMDKTRRDGLTVALIERFREWEMLD